MRIDAHQHFWKFDPVKHGWIDDSMAAIRKDFLPETLLPVLKSNQIEGTIAVQADECLEENEFLLTLSEKHPFIKGVVGWADLRSPQFNEQINSFTSFSKLVGFRCVMQGQDDEMYLKNKIFIKNIALLTTVNYTYDLLVYHHQLPELLRFVERLPDNKLILDHIGKPNIKQKNFRTWKENIKQLAQHPNLYCKLSGMITEADYKNWTYNELVPYMDAIGEAFGVNRICYGSDWPVCLVAGSYDRMMHLVKKWASPLTSFEQNQIFGLNTIKFYNL